MSREAVIAAPNVVAFATAGVVAFVIDLSVLAALTSLGMNPLCSRLMSMSLATFVGWTINRTWTYAYAARPSLREFASYVGTGAFSSLLNYAAFVAVMILWHSAHAVTAMIIATVISLIAAFLDYCRQVLRG